MLYGLRASGPEERTRADSTAGPLFDERAYERTVPGPGRDKWCVSALAIDVMHRKEKFADHETA